MTPPPPATPPDTRTFRQNYDTLRRIAAALQQQQEPDLDNLIPQVDEALRAHAACRARIEAVERLLTERLGEGQPG